MCLKTSEEAVGQIHLKKGCLKMRLLSISMCFLSVEQLLFCLNSKDEILASTGNLQVTKAMELYMISCGPQIQSEDINVQFPLAELAAHVSFLCSAFQALCLLKFYFS